jgi:hypothetical protein
MDQGTLAGANAILLRRRNKILLPASDAASAGFLMPDTHVAAFAKNVEALGYALSPDLIVGLRALSLGQITRVYGELVPLLRKMRGAHREFRPMYPNFPSQVMEMDQAGLYLNALIHYFTGGRLLPHTEVKERFPLLDEVELTLLDRGTRDEFDALFAQIAGSNTSLSEQDREELAWFAAAYGAAIRPLLPAAIPQKETLAHVASLLVKHAGREQATEFLSAYFKTATDVLRLAAALSGGDVSLAAATKFRTFSRPERAAMLALIERQPGATEDMLRWKGRWVRLGEKLHPGEHAKRFPKADRAFSVLRNDEPFPTFNGAVETALARRDVAEASARLGTRPGDFARRLDHLLRLAEGERWQVVAEFAEAAPRVATPVLLQVMHHFTVRNGRPALRVFFPKGNVAKAQAMDNTLPVLPEGVCAAVSDACGVTLQARFAALPPLGRVYVDPALRDYTAPFGMRSASKSLRTLVRGSRLPLPAGDVLRFFVWWRNGKSRTDIDLSAVMFDARFGYVNLLSYYNLSDFAGAHSGDIVDAPEGAAEFIDVSKAKLREANVRYVAMTLQSYTDQPFVELPECFAGWMARQEADSGEIFEPRTVQDRLDITADTKIALPLVIDVVDEKVVWCDMALRRHPTWVNNVHRNLTGVAATLRSLVEVRRPSLYDLFALHAEARGERVDSSNGADTVFSVESGTPFRLEEIASGYLA